MQSPAPARRKALTPRTLRPEVLRIQREIAPNAVIEFTGRTRTVTMNYPTGYVQQHYVLPMLVNGTPLEARYEVVVDGTSMLRFSTP